MKNEISQLKKVIENFKKLPKNTNPKEVIKQKLFRKQCNENNICYICGKELIRRCIDSGEFFAEFEYNCPDHGVMWTDLWA